MNEDLIFIQKCVEQVTGLDLATRTRKHEYIIARTIYYKICRELTLYSYGDIGGILNKDHSTVLHAIKNFKRDVAGDETNFKKYHSAFTIAEKILSERYDELKEGEKLHILMSKNVKLESEVEFLKMQIEKMESGQNENENRMLVFFRKLSFSDQMDVIFKTRTIWKVRNKLKQAI